MKKIIHVYNEIEEKFCTYTFLIVIVIIFIQVVGRYCFGNAPTWSEELSRYLYVWECWLGVSLTQREDRHIKLTFLVDMFPPRAKKAADAAAFVLSVGCAAMLAYYGIELVIFTEALGNLSPALKLPMWIFYLCLPLGCIAYICRMIGGAVVKIRNHAAKGGEA